MSDPTHLLVRIKPYNKPKGYLCITYIYRGFKYVNRNGWYKVRAPLARELGTLKQENGLDLPIFDVMTVEEAKATHFQEHAREQMEASPAAPNVVEPRSGSVRDGNRGGRRRAPAAATTDGGFQVTNSDPEPAARTEDEDVDEGFSFDSDEEQEAAPAAPPRKKKAAKKATKRRKTRSKVATEE